MNYSVAMRGVQSLRNLNTSLHELLGRQRAFGQALRKRLALDEFHYQVVSTVLVADIVQRANVWMI